MNRMYKVIWNRAKQCYTVVSEIAGSRTKAPSGRGTRNTAAAAMAAMVLTGGLTFGMPEMVSAEAGRVTDGQYIAVHTSSGNKGDVKTYEVNGQRYTYNLQSVEIKGKTYKYWVRDGYTIYIEQGKRFPGAETDAIVKAYKNDTGEDVSKDILSTNRLTTQYNGITTLNGMTLDDVGTTLYGGAVSSGGIGTPSSYNYFIKRDGKYIDVGGRNFQNNFKEATYDPQRKIYTTSDGTPIATKNLYVIDNKVGYFTTQEKGNEVYTGDVYGQHNEILVTAVGSDHKYYSIWGAPMDDPESPLKLTTGEYNTAMEKINDNIAGVHGDNIKEIKLASDDDNGGILSLVTNGIVVRDEKTGQYVVKEEGKTIPGSIRVVSKQENNDDVKIHFQQADAKGNWKDGFTVDAGSKVEGNKDGAKQDTTLQTLTINGKDYTIPQGKTYVDGDGIQLEEGNKFSIKLKEGEQNLHVDDGGLSLNQDITLGTGANKVEIKGSNGTALIGGVQIDGTENKSYVSGLSNTTWDGTTDNASRAATEGQLRSVSDVANKGWYLQLTGKDGGTYGDAKNVKPGATVNVKNTDGNIIATEPTLYGEGNLLIGVALNQDITLGNGIVLKGSDGTAVIGGISLDGKKGASYMTGLSNTTWDGTTDNVSRAATEGQLQEVSKKAELASAGWNIALADRDGNSWDPQHIKPGATVTVKNLDGNIVAEKPEADGEGNVTIGVKLSDKINLADGNIQLDGDNSIINLGQGGIVLNGQNQTAIFGNVTIHGDKGTVNGLTNTTWNPDKIVSGQAATEDQLKAISEKADQAQSSHTIVTAENQDAGENGQYSDGNIQLTKTTTEKGAAKYDVKLNDVITLGEDESKQITVDGKNGFITIGTQPNSQIKLGQQEYVQHVFNDQGQLVSGFTEVGYFLTGLTNTSFNITNGGYKAYKDSKRAATEGQLYDAFDFLNQKIDGITINGTTGKKDESGTGGTTGKDEAGGSGSGSGETGGTSTVTGSNNIVVTKDPHTDPDSPGWTLDLNNDKIHLGNDENNVTIKGTEGSVTATNSFNVGGKNGSSLKSDSLAVGGKRYITADGLNANEKKITKVAKGDISATSMDAVNGSQLFGVQQEVINNSQNISILNNRIGAVDKHVNEAAAGAAALAALHPLDFDPDDKLSFSAGYGRYKGEGSTALGAYYQPNENILVGTSTTIGNGDEMWNATVSFKLGSGSGLAMSRTAMAKKMASMEEENKDLRARVDLLSKQVEVLLNLLDTSKSKDFPDVPKNHWAYEAVSRLGGNGIVDGFPDGEFKGDRTLTRFEMAQMIYNALKQGAKAEARLVEEFRPELEAIASKDGK